MEKIKRIIALIAVFAFLFHYSNIYNVYADNDVYKDLVPVEAVEYAEENYKSGIDIVLSKPEMYGINGNADEFQLCEPYIIYNVENTVQDPLYYFPIRDAMENIVLVMAVFCTENGWSYSIGKDISDELNDVDYQNQECVIYGDDDMFCIENDGGIIQDNKVKGKKLGKFKNRKFDEKSRDIKRNYKVNFDVKYEEEKVDIEEAGFAIATTNCRLLDVSKAVVNQRINNKQEGICWAATVATINNYIMGQKISAKDVCDAVNHPYSGGGEKDIKRAFDYYGHNYNAHDVLDYDRIKHYIKAIKPIYMRTITTDGKNRHAVTLIGYDERIDGRYISVWNSAKEDYETLRYDGGNTSFGMSGSVYHWASSFSYK